ncbi:uncharacterized protein N7487_007614 [Penicillium crustosum]|uniref:uncharacterized protein n=1 Tax=Penicillium crustosum TaxID=36656 RepID=UPI0023A02C7D|nr:uncharacterized protein N7487_007614 [Penicillium crustosum]KAJ5401718.1 hypothetical protein N7487_007614 [Penicillium crustosum]
MAPTRDPKDVQAWLIGSGVASLAAAVHLINQTKVPARQVHILDVHHGSGGAMKTSGNSQDGYMLHTGAQPYFHGDCVQDLLAMIPSPANPDQTVWEDIKEQELHSKPFNRAHTRAIRKNNEGMRNVDMHDLRIGGKLRLDLITFILEGERRFDSKKISDVFEDKFFESEFWALWSTTFMLQPWHSAIEFHRLLAKYLPEMNVHNDVRELDKTPFSLYESLIMPVTTYLKNQGVDFRFHAMVTDLKLYPTSDPTTISEIVVLENEKEMLITVDPVDIVIVTLGSLSTGKQTGSNAEPPQPYSLSSDTLKHGEWGLWQKLSNESSKFGNPLNFLSRLDESKIETFTTTLHDSDFMEHYAGLTHDKPGTGALLTVLESPWGLNISVSHQPVFATQPKSVHVVWGYGLHPEKKGKFVQKPMEICSGEEIFFELLSLLGFPVDSLLPSSITIPCIMPLGTSMLLSRTKNDRPRVLPHETTNIAFIGQFVEIPDDTTYSFEYSVRGAQMAVCGLLNLGHSPKKIKKNRLLEVFGLLV